MDVEAIWTAVERYYRLGLHPAMQLCVRRRGQVVLDRSIGHIRGAGPDDPPESDKVLATPTTRFSLFSASKSVTAMLIHLLDERRALRLDDPVARYVPEFAQHGKGEVTIRHVLLHRAGLPRMPEEAMDPALFADWDAIVEILCAMRPETYPGRTASYHALSGGFVLGEVLRRVDGRDVRTFLREEVCEPLALDLSYGVPAEELHTLPEEVFTGPLPRFPFANLIPGSVNVQIDEVVRIANTPEFRTGVVPSGNLMASANQSSRFMELLLRGGELDGVRVFAADTVRRAIAEQTYLELDRTLRLPVRYGLGFMLGADALSFYGPATPRAFGHLGFTNILTWADPERDISVSLLNSGKPFMTPELLAWMAIPMTINHRIPRDGLAA